MSRVRSTRRKRTHMRGGAKTPMQAIIAANKKALMKGVPKIGKKIVKHGSALAGKVVTGAWEGSKDLGKQLLLDTGIKGYLDGFDKDKIATGLARQSWGANVALIALGYEPIDKIHCVPSPPLITLLVCNVKSAATLLNLVFTTIPLKSSLSLLSSVIATSTL